MIFIRSTFLVCWYTSRSTFRNINEMGEEHRQTDRQQGDLVTLSFFLSRYESRSHMIILTAVIPVCLSNYIQDICFSQTQQFITQNYAHGNMSRL